MSRPRPILYCRCGHPLSIHKNGGRCGHGCGCLVAHPFAPGRGGLTVLEQLSPGVPGKVAPTSRVRCGCGRVYLTKSFARDLATRRSCRVCSDARRALRAATRTTPRAPRPHDLPPPARFAHGSRSRYVSGCRCEPCRESNRVYSRYRQKLARAGQGDPLVSAARARAHLLRLARAGIGRRFVADLARVPTSSLHAIRQGTKVSLRRSTEARILSVTKGAISDGHLVDAGPVRQAIARLLRAGFTRSAIAARLGSSAKTPALQIGKRDRVTAKTRARVARLLKEIDP